ncbi:MAG TPA: sigma-54 dependent transcriptional regulator [Verrucomicrobiae bacterium]|nr:sigma-54 dependent transcriptional regulator [Verrucomicrobiae bacterium]
MDRILIVDDEAGMRDMLSILLRKEGYGVAVADRAEKAIEMASKGEFDLVMSDISMPGKSGIEVLRQTKAASPDTPVILVTAYASTESAVEALKLGAYDYLIKPFDVEELKNVVRNALEKRRLETENRVLKRELKRKTGSDTLVGEAPRMREVLALIERIAPTHSTVLIGGESGTGKELAARAIHAQSPRRDRPFVSINCGALPDELLESELFGHTRGSFTGAVTSKKGLFEVADGGTVFLDEIGDTTPAMQVKLLRVLQERRIRRVGGTEETEVNVRVLAATNHDLEALVREKRFRGPLLPHQRHPDRHAAAAGEARGHPAPGGSLRGQVRIPDGKEGLRRVGRGAPDAAAARLARERARAGERHRAGRGSRLGGDPRA